MVPIQDVLHRIQWDPAWRGGRFEIGYLDRVAGAVIRVAFPEHHRDAEQPGVLALHDADGAAVRIPLHRVREVWRDGALIWARRPGGGVQSAGDRDAHD